MLALSLEQGRREGGGVDCLQKGAAVTWQGSQSDRPPHEQRIDIRAKISQWESRSQDAGVKANPVSVFRTVAGDVLSNGCFNEGLRGGLHAKASLSKSQSLGLDFRESQAQEGHGAVGRKSEPLQKCSTKFQSAGPKNDPMSKQIFTCNSDQKVDCILHVEVVSKHLPQSTDDQEDSMPPGNFYTSQGFWRKLDGDRLRWEKGRESSGEAKPPPKPQRTFQYRGANRNTGHTIRWDSKSPHNNRPVLRSRRVAHPPSFPPPPCPVAKTDGLSRHKTNR